MGDLIQEIKLDRALPVPPALESFAATPFDAHEIDIGWLDNSPFAIDYDIEWATNVNFTGAASDTIPASPHSGGFYQITGLLANTHYWIRVKARNPMGSSAWVTDDAITPP